jgi:hypothetical protein
MHFFTRCLRTGREPRRTTSKSPHGRLLLYVHVIQTREAIWSLTLCAAGIPTIDATRGAPGHEQ